MHCLTPRLSSPLWLGPAYLAPRSSLVCAREKAILFDSCSSFASSSWAHPGEVFLADSVAEPSHGFSMVSLDCGAVESPLLRLANSTDLQVNPGLIVVDLDAVGPVSSCRSPSCSTVNFACCQWAGLHSLEFLFASVLVPDSSGVQDVEAQAAAW